MQDVDVLELTVAIPGLRATEMHTCPGLAADLRHLAAEIRREIGLVQTWITRCGRHDSALDLLIDSPGVAAGLLCFVAETRREIELVQMPVIR